MEPPKCCHGCDTHKDLSMFKTGELRCVVCRENEKKDPHFFVKDNEPPLVSQVYTYAFHQNKAKAHTTHRFAAEAKYKCRGCGEYKSIVREFTRAPANRLGFNTKCKSCIDPNHDVILSTNYDTPPLLCDDERLKQLEFHANQAYYPQHIFGTYNPECDRTTHYGLHVFDVIPRPNGRSYDVHTECVCSKCHSPDISVKIRGILHQKKGNSKGFELGQFEFKCKHCNTHSEIQDKWLNKTFFNDYKKSFVSPGYYMPSGWKRRVLAVPENANMDQLDASPDPPMVAEIQSVVPKASIQFTDLLASGHHLTPFKGGILITGTDGSWFLDNAQLQGLIVKPVEMIIGNM